MTAPASWEEDGLNKSERLEGILRSYGRVLVAFSGGCDSALVLKVARETLGRGNVLAVIAKSPSLPESELASARETACEIDAELLEIETNELENSGYAANSAHRCYFCKTELYTRLLPIAQERGFPFILNGTNLDDLGDWRPGLRAAEENQVRSPLAEAGLKKEEIRALSKRLGLSTWSKPQAACLSSRIPFGVAVTPERLKQVEEGEEILKEAGFHQVRLRWFGKSATIEVGGDETGIFFHNAWVREKTLEGLKALGFETIDLCLEGYRSGRLNPSLTLSSS